MIKSPLPFRGEGGERGCQKHPQTNRPLANAKGLFQFRHSAKELPPVRNAFRQFLAEHALVVFCHQYPLGLVAFVQE